jgi:hypothetical protein
VGKYVSEIRIEKIKVHIGCYDDPVSARADYESVFIEWYDRKPSW